MAQWGHRLRFELIANREMPIVTDKILWYAFGVAGRVFDLPRQYQDAIARAVVVAHPQSFYRRALLYCIVSDGYVKSTHPKLAGLNRDEVLELCNTLARGYRRTRRDALAAAREVKSARNQRLRSGKRVIR